MSCSKQLCNGFMIFLVPTQIYHIKSITA